LDHGTLLFLLLAVLLLADNVADEVVDKVRGALGAGFDKTISHDDMRQALEVLVLRGRPRQLLRDDVLGQIHRSVLHFGANITQVGVKLEDDRLALLARENLLQHFVANALRQLAPITSDHVETFDFLDDSFVFGAPVYDIERSILLLLEKEQ